MSWTSFKDAADKSLHKKGLTPQLRESLVLEKANQLLAETFGQDAGDKIRAVYWRNYILTLAVLDDALLYRLETGKEQFLGKLNSEFAEQTVKDIKVLS